MLSLPHRRISWHARKEELLAEYKVSGLPKRELATMTTTQV